MSLEIEKKYLNPDLEAVCQRLWARGARFRSCHFEENWLFDTPDRSLRSSNILLRLRRANGGTLTVKKKPEHAAPPVPTFKVLEELETQVEDAATMHTILELLGYVTVFHYEKFRAMWQWESCTICLDTLPFTQVVELEGTPESIGRAATRFGLDTLESSAKNYIQLYRDHCRSRGVHPNDRFLFPETQQAALRACAVEMTNHVTPCAVFQRRVLQGA